MTVGDVIVEVCTLFRIMSLRLKRQLVTYLFRQFLRNTVSDVGFLKFVGKDFLDISVQAMQKLYCAGTEPHYARWLETMYSHFGHKWLCLFWGPTWQYKEDSQVTQSDREVDILEMALNISDISLREDNLMEAEVEPGDVGEECTSTNNRKRTEEEKDDSMTTSTNTANVSTLWSQLDQQDVAEISEGLEDPKTVQEAAGVNTQASWQKQNS